MKTTQWLSAAFVTLLPLALGMTIGFIYRADAWYRTLNKPAITPPPIAFQVVWPVLYLCIGLSAWLALNGVNGRNRM
jgi:translocator protein